MMFELFVPYLPVEAMNVSSTPAIQVAQATVGAGVPSRSGAGKVDMVLADCEAVQGPEGPAKLNLTLQPAGALHNYWYEKYKKVLDVSNAKVTILEGSKHGTLEVDSRNHDLGPAISYTPERGYLGRDKVIFLVEAVGKRVKVVTTLHVVEHTYRENNYDYPCTYNVKRISGLSGSSAPLANASNKADRTVGICHIVPNGSSRDLQSAEFLILPVDEAIEYFRLYERRTVADNAKVTILRNPRHGILEVEGDGAYRYQPYPGYLGKDQATVLVEIGCFKVKVAYFFQAIDGGAIGNTTYKDLCGKKGYRWRI